MTMPNVFAEGEGWTLYRGDAIALLSGRRFVGVERCLEHCEVAARRLSEASGNYRPSTTPQLGLLGGA